jgi:SagB-type dehydrogenase family enzyme
LALASILRREPAIPFEGDVGEIYHEWSKPKLIGLLGSLVNWGDSPLLYKEYAGAQRISLPPPQKIGGLSTTEAILQRRSVRSYSNQDLSLEELSNLLYYTCGINSERWGRKLRAAPSAGALYPIEIYVVLHRTEGLVPGLYHYAVKDHALEQLQTEDLRGEIVFRGLGQEFLGKANLVLVFTAIFQRLRWKYQERAYRYALLEAGHLGQNVYLVGTSMGLGVCAVGAFLDDELNSLLGIDGQEEAAVYTLAVGKYSSQGWLWFLLEPVSRRRIKAVLASQISVVYSDSRATVKDSSQQDVITPISIGIASNAPRSMRPHTSCSQRCVRIAQLLNLIIID